MGNATCDRHGPRHSCAKCGHQPFTVYLTESQLGRDVSRETEPEPAWDIFPHVEPEPMTWVFPDWVPMGCTSELAGRGGAGKGLAALQMAAAVASGNTHPFGQLDTEFGDATRGPVLNLPRSATAGIISAEDDRNELARRLWRLPDVDGMPIRDAVDERLLIHRPTAPMWTEAGEGQGINAVRAGLDLGMKLLVIDPAASVFEGNENDRMPVTQFIDALNRLAQDHDAAILLVVHPSKSSSISGSTAWVNASRRVIALDVEEEKTKEKTRRCWKLRGVKSNYGPQGGEICLSMRNVVWYETTAADAWHDA